jgi:hypothetical protein
LRGLAQAAVAEHQGSAKIGGYGEVDRALVTLLAAKQISRGRSAILKPIPTNVDPLAANRRHVEPLGLDLSMSPYESLHQ